MKYFANLRDTLRTGVVLFLSLSAATATAQSNSAVASENATTATYETFSEKEQAALSGIALKLVTQKANLGAVSLNVSERVFLRDQVGNEQHVVQALKERMITLSDDKEHRVGPAEQALLDRLSEAEVASLRFLASAYLASDANTLRAHLNKKDLDLYQWKSAGDKDKLNKLLLMFISALADSTASN